LTGYAGLASASLRAAASDELPALDDVDATAAPPARPGVGQAELSKREAWLRDKASRKDVHLGDADVAPRTHAPPLSTHQPSRAGKSVAGRLAQVTESSLPPPGARLAPVTTLFNVWTREALPLLPGLLPSLRLHPFLRDHHTNQATYMDTRLLDVLAAAAERFAARRIEVVSGYRSPKYNLMLRKKGRQVARSSQHVEGQAVDFRIRGVPTKSLLQFVRSLRRGGVGFYPHSQFVHSDTGPIRFWKGT
jgi:hypothetical protein